MSNTMPEGFNPEDWTVDQATGQLRPREDSVPRNWRRDLEARAKAGDEAKARVAELERQLAVRDAGIKAGDPLADLFLKAYDGPADVEAIKAEAAKYGLLNLPPEQQAQIDQSLAGHQAAMQTAAGSQTQTGGVDHQAALRAIAGKHRGPNSSEAAKAEIAQYMQEHFGPSGVDAMLGR